MARQPQRLRRQRALLRSDQGGELDDEEIAEEPTAAACKKMAMKPKSKAKAVKARRDRIPYPPIVPPTAAQRQEAETAQEPPKKAQRAELAPPWRQREQPPPPPRQESSAASSTSTSTLGERPKYIPDPTPNYGGCDYESWTRQETIQYWEQLSPEDQSSEFNALRRTGKWKNFKDIVFHATTPGFALFVVQI